MRSESGGNFFRKCFHRIDTRFASKDSDSKLNLPCLTNSEVCLSRRPAGMLPKPGRTTRAATRVVRLAAAAYCVKFRVYLPLVAPVPPE